MSGLAKEWARGFYASVMWRQQRLAYGRSRHWLCERCGRRGKIVHHVVALTPENIRDGEVSLGFGNLELLCQDCHNDEHLSACAVGDGLYFDEDGNLVQSGAGRADGGRAGPPGVEARNLRRL